MLLEKVREREKSAEENTDALRNEKKAKDEKEKATAEGNQTSGLQTMAESRRAMIVARNQQKLN